MARLKNYWCAKVIRTNGRTVQYRLTMDLQHALNGDPQGRNEMQNALLVIPLAPYLPGRKPRKSQPQARKKSDPPFGIGRVIEIYRLPANVAQRFQVTRSQFIGREYWTTRPFKICNTYLRHDYPWLSQKQIAADITYWQNRLFKDHPRENRFWRFITRQRVHHQLKQIQHRRFRYEQKKWRM
ncbi:hypothetical protein ACFQ22_04920 [Lentilactobacillus raoultii]|uniref:Uncharacterized protein n=1 Tax=Lentilactobacillus raoultii TaxID=1987503 RepID=A0ABW3PHZ6_9LACO|nr:hypothetical protein [Lentilactobacillus raoultii]